VLKRKNNILLSIFLLIFVGQATASAISFCPMAMNSPDSTEASEALLHASHGKMMNMRADNMKNQNMRTAMMQDMNMSQDCCSQADHCSMANCAIPGISADFQFNIPERISHSINIEYFSFTRKSTTSLYRPPIFA
jgi:hypothetical protein